MRPWVAALAIGVACGMRTFTGPAALQLAGGGRWRVPAALVAIGEYVGDLLPQTPARTMPAAVVARVVSGGSCGRLVAERASCSSTLGMAAGAAGALLGTYGGLRLRLAAVERIGAVPAALLEDAVAIGLAAAATASGSA